MAPKKKATAKKTTDAQELANIQKMLADLDKQAKKSLASVAPSVPAVPPAIAMALGLPQPVATPGGKITQQAEQVQAAAEIAKNAIQGFAQATGSGVPSDLRPDMPPPPPATTPPPGMSVTGTDAFDTFRKTLALILGEKEANKAYVSSVFNRFFGYQKQGVDQDTALNLVLRDARDDQALAPFRQRFRAVLALEDMKAGGKIVDVPTIKEYIQAEQQLGEVLNRAELGDLATEDFIADVFSKGKSVKEATDIITTVQSRVKNAPLSVRQQWQALYPTMTDAQITKAILLGPAGAAQLKRQAEGLDVRAAAAEAKSLMPTQAEAEELASRGYTFGTSLQGFQNIAGFFPQTQVIAERFKRQPFTAQQAMAYQFGGDAAAKKEIETLRGLESGLFQARTGAASTALGTQTKGIV